MYILKTPFAVAGWLACLQICSADTIVMKDGEKIEGRVLREANDEYVIEVRVSETIRDERKVAVGDVEKIEKEQPDIKAFGKIEDLVPTPELLPVAAYEARIEKVESFIEEYPKSGKASKAKEMLDYLSEELITVRAGGIKFGEEMIAADDYMANAYEYDAMISARKIKEAVARREFVGALRLFTTYEKDFSGASGRDEIVSLIRQVLSAYKATIDESLASIDSRIEKRQAGLASMAGEDRVQTERALADQEEMIAARYEEEKGSNEAWITPDSYHKESLTDALRQVENETRRLDSPAAAVQSETPVAEAYRLAWGRLSGGTPEEKNAVIAEAAQSGLSEKYLSLLRERGGIEKP